VSHPRLVSLPRRLQRRHSDWTYDAAAHEDRPVRPNTPPTPTVADEPPRVSGADTLVDTYVITRFGGRCEAAVHAGRAQPFYTARSDSQRVRYDGAGCRPSRCSARALTGKNGADYLGIMSSHNRYGLVTLRSDSVDTELRTSAQTGPERRQRSFCAGRTVKLTETAAIVQGASRGTPPPVGFKLRVPGGRRFDGRACAVRTCRTEG